MCVCGHICILGSALHNAHTDNRKVTGFGPKCLAVHTSIHFNSTLFCTGGVPVAVSARQ